MEFSLEDMDTSGFQQGATYRQIKERVLEQTGLKVSSLYISHFFLKRSFSVLTNPKRSAIITITGFVQGEMAEWLKALVLKTSDVERHRGFESLSLRQMNMEKYPRGRRGSPAKGVGWVDCREGSNPSFSAINTDISWCKQAYPKG